MIRTLAIRGGVHLGWVFALLCAGPLLAAPSKQAIDAVVQRAMSEFQVPGMSVSVVYEGSVYYAEGHGIAEIGGEQAVDAGTLFQIGSVSKAFTAAALAILVDDGKLGWDDPVIDHLPEFRMYDPWVTREFTVRDLLTHRSGLPLGAGDLLMFPEGQTTREEIIRALRHLKPSSSFRSKFDYDNLLYIVAGEVVAAASGMGFEDFLEQRLLTPAGMAGCAATLERTAPDAARATPHLLIDGELQTTTGGASGLIAAAGGVNCSARGMAQWMTLVLNSGATAGGEQIISPAQFGQLVGPVTVQSPSPLLQMHAGAFLGAYALGWNLSTFYGEPAYSHGGGLWGMTTYIMVLPRRGLALFASNNQMSAAPVAVVNHLADLFLADLAPQAGKDWVGIVAAAMKQRQEQGAAVVAEAEAGRNADSRPSLPLEAYVGTYRDAWYGDIHIRLGDDGGLWFHSDRNAPLTGPLEHFQFDTFIARWSNRQLMADAYVSFTLDPAGRVERIRMKAVSPTTDFSYDFHDLDLRRVE